MDASITKRIVRASRLFATALLLASPAWAQGGYGLALAPGEAAPPLAGHAYPDDEPVEIDWAAAKVTLVNFWADWCRPCRKEMPSLENLHERRAADGLRIVGVFDPSMDRYQVARYVTPMAISYRLLRPDEHVNGDWGGIAVLPTSFLVDPEGRILRRYVGARPQQVQGLIADVEAVLDGQPLPPMVIPGPEERTSESAFGVPGAPPPPEQQNPPPQP